MLGAISEKWSWGTSDLRGELTKCAAVVCRLLVHSNDRSELTDGDEFYAQDLHDLEVVLSDDGHERDGVVLGTVTDIHDGTGEYDTLRIAFVPNIVLREDGMLVDVATLNEKVCPFCCWLAPQTPALLPQQHAAHVLLHSERHLLLGI
jgi:hypothetical protein